MTHRLSQKKDLRHYRLWLEEGLSDFNNCWYEYSWHNWPSNDHLISHLTSPQSASALPGEKQNKQNNTFLFKAVWLLNWNNTHKAHFVQISVTLAESLSNFSVVQLLIVNIQNTQARRCFLHSFIAVSMMFCSRLQPVASWVQHS